MPCYLVDITELPYPHGMGARGEHSNCPFAISTLRRKLRKPVHWSPGPQVYRELFTDEALLLRARSWDVHQGDWAVVLPVVVAFLAAIPAAADTLIIARAARSDPRFDSLSADDRSLALALLSYSKTTLREDYGGQDTAVQR